MISAILAVGTLVAVGIGGPLYALITEPKNTYGTDLEQYIISRNPLDSGDIDRLTREYERKHKESYL